MWWFWEPDDHYLCDGFVAKPQLFVLWLGSPTATICVGVLGQGKLLGGMTDSHDETTLDP